MFRGVAALILVLALALAVGGCKKVDAVARVNGEDITRAEFDRIYAQVAKQMGGEIPDDMAADYKRQLLDMMIESKIITQEAEELGADLSDEAVSARIDELRGETDEETFNQQVEEAGLTRQDLEDSIRDQIAREYLTQKAAEEESSGTLPETYTLLEHILVADEATAQDLKAQIDGGADFAELATANSTDPGSAAQGGSLGWSPTSAYVEEFANAAEQMEVGQVSEPVQSQFGWHIIRKVDEVQEGDQIADAPAELQSMLQANSGELALQDYVARLRDEAEIEYLDESLAPTNQ